MRQEPMPPAPEDRLGAIWRTEPIRRSPRPWLLAALTLACIAFVVAGSLGPWLYVGEGPEWDMEYRTLAGVNTDGVFSLFFATVAAALVLIALARPHLWVIAWAAFLAMVLCSLVGLFDWVLFDPLDLADQPHQRAELVRVEWGLKLLTVSAPVGAICALLFARHLMRGDY